MQVSIKMVQAYCRLVRRFQWHSLRRPTCGPSFGVSCNMVP